MSAPEPFPFAFIRKLGAHLSEEEIADSEARFAMLLDTLSEVALAQMAREDAGDKRFDESGPAPYDSTRPATST